METRRCAVFGFGYLGRPLAERLYQNGWQLAALKKQLTSDDINLPLDIRAVGQDETGRVFQTALHDWRGFDAWIFLLPPSACPNYAETVRQWAQAAEKSGVKHLILTSSTGVYGAEARQCDEYCELQPQSGNARQIVAAEQAVLTADVPNRDIFRLGGLYCAERHPVFRLSTRPQIENGQHAVNILHRSRAVAALAFAAETPKGVRIRNLVENRHPSRAEFYAAEAVKLGLPKPEFQDNGGRGKTVGTAYQDFARFLTADGETGGAADMSDWNGFQAAWEQM